MKKITLSLLILLVVHTIVARNVGIGTNTPASSAALDISSSNKGLLISWITTALRKAIPSPAIGLLVFDTDKGALYLFDGQIRNPFAYAMTSGYLATEGVPSGCESRRQIW